jgi:hypothetical protein
LEGDLQTTLSEVLGLLLADEVLLFEIPILHSLNYSLLVVRTFYELLSNPRLKLDFLNSFLLSTAA